MYIGTTGRMYRFPWYNPVRLSMEWLSLAYVVFIPFMYLAIYWFRRNHDRGVQGNSYKRKMREKMDDSGLVNFSGITREERRRRKKKNSVTTGFNLAVYLIEIMAIIIAMVPVVGGVKY